VLVGCGGGGHTTNVAPKDAEADLQVAQEIMRLEQLWGQALARRDTAFFSRILAPEFLTTGGELIKSKEEVIQELARGSGPLAVPQLRSTRIKVYGDVAVVTGLVTFDAPGGAWALHSGGCHIGEVVSITADLASPCLSSVEYGSSDFPTLLCHKGWPV
jgi:hypothetical protein